MFVNTCNTIFVYIIPLCPHDEEKLENVAIFRGEIPVSKYVVNPHVFAKKNLKKHAGLQRIFKFGTWTS